MDSGRECVRVCKRCRLYSCRVYGCCVYGCCVYGCCCLRSFESSLIRRSLEEAFEGFVHEDPRRELLGDRLGQALNVAQPKEQRALLECADRRGRETEATAAAADEEALARIELPRHLRCALVHHRHRRRSHRRRSHPRRRQWTHPAEYHLPRKKGLGIPDMYLCTLCHYILDLSRTSENQNEPRFLFMNYFK